MEDQSNIDTYLNTIIQGDCLEVLKQFPDKSVDLVLTDPPYGMEFRSNHRQVKYEAITNDDSLYWLEMAVSEAFRVLKDDSHAYFFCSFHNVDVFKQELAKKFEVKNLLVWVKNNTGMGDLEGDYAPQYELILFCTKGRKILNGGRDSNVLKSNKTGNNLHPTEKPVDLISYLMEKSSREGDLVLDPFGGSCTTAVACKQLKRNYICIEKEAKYVAVCHERLKQDLLF